MAAIGAGGLDVALAMGGAPFYLPCPEVVHVVLTGPLGPWVSAKDLVLKMLEIFGTKGNVGRIFEYAGPGLAWPHGARAGDGRQHGRRMRRHHLDLPERRDDPRLPPLAGPRGRLAARSPPIPTPTTRWRSRSTSASSSPSPPLPTRRATSCRCESLTASRSTRSASAPARTPRYKDLATVAPCCAGESCRPT